MYHKITRYSNDNVNNSEKRYFMREPAKTEYRAVPFIQAKCYIAAWEYLYQYGNGKSFMLY